MYLRTYSLKTYIEAGSSGESSRRATYTHMLGSASVPPGHADETMIMEEAKKRRSSSLSSEDIRRLVRNLSAEDLPPLGLADLSRGGSCVEGPENDPTDHRSSGDESESSSSEDWMQQFEIGVHYPLIPGRLYFSCHSNERYTREAIESERRLFYFSSHLPGA